MAIDGQRLDPQALWLLTLKRLSPGLETLEPPRARRRMRFEQAMADAEPPPMHEVRDLTIPGPAGPIPARLYRPLDRPGLEPALLYFHGGGFVLGDLETHDVSCRILALRSEAAVVAVDYRLAPEHPFPAAMDDAAAAWRWFVQSAASLGLDPERLAVGGDSAGGTLAAVVCHECTPSPRHQLLIYPSVDRASKRPSRALFAEGFMLTGSMTAWFMAHFLAGADPADPRVSPLRRADFAGQPPATVIIAGYDILRDEIEAYVERLQQAGVPVTALRCEGLFHGFIQTLGVVTSGRAVLEAAAEHLGRAL